MCEYQCVSQCVLSQCVCVCVCVCVDRSENSIAYAYRAYNAYPLFMKTRYAKYTNAFLFQNHIFIISYEWYIIIRICNYMSKSYFFNWL